MTLTKIDDRGLNYPLEFKDNEKLHIGTNSKTQLYHSGTQFYLRNSNGNIYLQIQSTKNGVLIRGADGSVELYHDGSKKLETTSGGIDVTGQVKADELYLLDNEVVKLGVGGDLQIYHTGSGSRIENITGTFSISNAANEIQINKASSEYMARFITDGAVELYHNNSKKFETTSYGALIGQTTSAASVAVPNRLSLGSDYHDAVGESPKLSIWQSTDGGDHMGFGVSGNQLDVILTSNNYDFVVYGGNSGNTERLRVFGDGGLSFNGDLSDANKLSDYEEGSFTPTLLVGGSDSGIVYGTQSAKYVKIGRLVHVNVHVAITNKGSGTGHIHFGGLPFQVADDLANTQHEASGSVGYISGLGTNAIFFTVSAVPSPNALMFTLSAAASNATPHATQIHLSNSFGIRCSCTYFTDA